MPYNWVVVKPLLAPPQQPGAEAEDHSTQVSSKEKKLMLILEDYE